MTDAPHREILYIDEHRMVDYSSIAIVDRIEGVVADSAHCGVQG